MYITHTAHITHILHVHHVYSTSLRTLRIYATILNINNYIYRTLTKTSLYNETHAHICTRLRMYTRFYVSAFGASWCCVSGSAMLYVQRSSTVQPRPDAILKRVSKRG